MVTLLNLARGLAGLGAVVAIGVSLNPDSIPSTVQGETTAGETTPNYVPMNYEPTTGKVQGVPLKQGGTAPPCSDPNPMCVIVVKWDDYQQHQAALDTIKAETSQKCIWDRIIYDEKRADGSDRIDFCIAHKPSQKDDLYAKVQALGVPHTASGLGLLGGNKGDTSPLQ